MKRVYSSHDYLLVRHYKNLLEGDGITCILKNDFLTGAVGELPPTACWPELWVIDDRDAGRAESLLADADDPGTGDEGSWSCGDCGESIGNQFGQCWNCGALRLREGD